MNLYVDSSVLLRVALQERHSLSEWSRSKQWVASRLVRVECLRTLDRLRLQLSIEESVAAERRALLQELLDGFTLVPLDNRVLNRAGEPFPTTLGTLDALHLASALAAREAIPDLLMATHDRELAVAARAVGFEVLGAETAR